MNLNTITEVWRVIGDEDFDWREGDSWLAGGTFMLTVSASTVRPIRLSFDQVPDARSLRERLRETIADSMYHDDVHGAPDYRKHLTFHFAEEIRGELSSQVS